MTQTLQQSTSQITPYVWKQLPDDQRIGKVYGDSATPENIERLNLIAQHQTVSPKGCDIKPGWNYKAPSLELFQEMIWDRTADLDMTDEEVRDLAVWAGHKFLGYSQRALAQSWGVSRGVILGILQRKERNVTDEDVQNAVLVTAMSA